MSNGLTILINKTLLIVKFKISNQVSLMDTDQEGFRYLLLRERT